MKDTLIVFLVWSFTFPINLFATLVVVAIQLTLKIFDMPFAVWNEIDSDLKEMRKQAQK